MKTRLILFIILVLSVFAHNDETGGTKKAYYITISTITVNSTTSISFTGTVDLTDIDYAQWKVDGGSYQNFDPNNLGTGITVTVSAMATGVYHTLYLKAVYDTGGGGGSTPGPDVEVNYVYDVFERYANQSFYVNGPPVSISVTGKNSMGSTSSNFALNENFYYDVASTYGVVAYKWSEDNSVWSSEIAYTTNLYASSLSDSMKTYGNHTLYFKGKSQDGSWMSSSVSKNYSISEFPPADISVSHNLSDLNEVFEKDSLEFTIASTYSVTQYKWQLNDSVWSDPVSQSTVLDFETIFADAANRIGSHTVSFIGGNSNNEWMATIDKVSFNLTITFYNSSRNYMILTNSGVSANDSLTSLDSKSRSVVSKSISYTDAIGRKLQSVARQGSGSGKDIIMHVEYDQYGLQSKEFLPYVSTDSTGSYKISSATEQSAYYSGSGYDNTKKIQLTNYPYSETKTEHSPLNKAVEKGAPGATWRLGAGHTALTKTAVNDSAEVFYFDEDGLKSTTNNYYPAESLRIIETIDENGNSSFEYSDSRDKVVMKKSNDGTNDIITYYVYDDDGNLRFIIPPMASATITSGANWDADSETHLNSWVTRFIYDSQNRLIEKRTPEAGTIYTAYDNLDRPVMTQDENLKAKGYWMFSKFDYKNRPVYTGIVQLASSRATVQTALQSESVYWESKASNEIGYTDNAYPRGVTTANILSINYYDNYDNPVTDAVDLQTAVYDAVYAFTRIEGKATASKTRVLHGSDFFSHTVYPNLIDLSSNLTGTYSYNDAQQIIFSSSTLSEIIIDSETEITVDGDAEVTIGPGLSASPVSVAMPVEFLTSYSLYDDRGRVIRSVADNPMGGKDSVITKYDWAGKITYSENYHWAAGGDDTDNKIVSTPHYDALNRLAYTSVSQIFKGRSAINYVPSLTLFNDLGQPYLSYIQPNSSYISQDGNGIYTFSGSSSDYLYSLETKMNERGWKTSIQAKKGSTVLFEEDLGYDSQLTSGTDFTAQYNGNISGVEYEQRYGTSNTRTYQYNYLYDQINQLAKAKYIAHSNAGTTDDYTVSDFAYDRNGNINRLRRKRGTDYIDDLTYTYSNNQITSIADAGNDAVDGLYGFVDGSNTANEYSYDANGNLVTDLNKGVDLIQYNHLNLPVRFLFDNGDQLFYEYDAMGNKLRRHIQLNDGSVTQDYRYSGAYVYESNDPATDPVLAFTNTGGSRLKDYNGTNQFEQFISDHLSNTRVTLRKSATDYTFDYLQDRHYYAFGMVIDSLSSAESPDNDNRISYNGKEIDKRLRWYHYGARFYDPTVGRWWSIDPVDEFFTPYGYVGNKPINAIDPDGKDTWVIHGTWSDYTKGFGLSNHEKWAGIFNDKMSPAFNWSRENNEKARELAANNLAEMIIENYKNNGGAINIVAHSHGGNVAIMAANIIAEKGYKVDNLVLIGTPNRLLEHQYQLNDGVVKGSVINIWNPFDWVQPKGGGFVTDFFGLGEIGLALPTRTEQNVDNIMIPTIAPNGNHSYQNQEMTMDAVSNSLENN